jgi:hypothetical protein
VLLRSWESQAEKGRQREQPERMSQEVGITTTTVVTHPDGTAVTVTTTSAGVPEAEPPIVKDERPRVLATGGAGFIGSHTVVELLGAGMAVVCVQPRPPQFVA